jgi:beta-mannosidase
MTTLSGRPRIQSVTAHRRIELTGGWELCSTDPDAGVDPAMLVTLCPVWRSAAVPGTVAEHLRRAGSLDLDHVPNFDDRDWWYRCEFDAEPNATPGTRVLRFDGLATLADVWVNDQPVLASDDMFIAHEVDVSGVLRERNTLVIRFRSLTAALTTRRPRPRWRTKLVEHQQLRWMRTTLLGRMPGWSPPVRAVGPWRVVTLESRDFIAVENGDVRPVWDEQGAAVETSLTIRELGGARVQAATLLVGDERCQLRVVSAEGQVELSGSMRLLGAKPWWPHTHGDQPLYDARLVVATDRGDATIELGALAFRSITVTTADGGFTVVVNGTPVFCRGACWTTPDIVTLGATSARYDALVESARDAGMNMLRVGGTMTYEADAFYDACDRLGVLVWQDFMFATMDYPVADAAFMRTVECEVTVNLARLRRHACLAVLCGGSEVEQQAAMLGVPSEQWGRKLFHEQLPAWCEQSAPRVPYWPSSPSGGALPFHTDVGVSHYYGVGAYMRPLEDARRSNVRFAAECLGFANVPEQSVIDSILPAGESPVHHPRWKARVPRDHGAGWDFEDVRDHYLEALFGVHPMRLRYADMERYLALSRVVTGEVMARTIGEWRRGDSSCSGALIWFLQDLWPGAGWGLLDATGRPKPAYYAVKRAMQPVALAITDEGTNGLHVHVANDRACDLAGVVRIALFRDGRVCTDSGSAAVTVPARGSACLGADAMLGRFYDVAYAYRFGAPGHDLVVATLHDATGVRIADAFHSPLGLTSRRGDDVGLAADVERRTDGSVALVVRSERFAQFVAVDAGDAVPDDNYFHVAPGDARLVTFQAASSARLTEIVVQPLNASDGVRVSVPAVSSARL